MSQLVTPEVEVDKIDVEDGFNARKSFDDDALKAFAKSIKRSGVVQPIVVRPKDGGRFALIAGERRLRGARLAGLKKIPAVPGDEARAHTTNFVENSHRAEFNPVEDGEGLEAVAKELGIRTNKDLAHEVGMSTAWVGVRRRILKLPAAAKKAIAEGVIPVEAEPLLREVAKVSPRIAECACILFEKQEEEPGEFVRDFEHLIFEVAGAVAEGDFGDDAPTMLDTKAIRLSSVIDEGAKRDEIAARHNAALAGHRPGTEADPIVRLGQPEVDAAAAAGVLLDRRDNERGVFYGSAFITDKEMAADLILRAVDRMEKEAKKRAKDAEKMKKQAEKEAEAKAKDPERIKEEKERKAAIKADEEQRAAARSYNEKIGRNLLKRRGAQGRKKFGLARMKAAAISLILHDRELAGTGLRLVMPQLQGLQPETDGKQSGGKVTYATDEKAREFLIERVEQAKSVPEIAELIAEAQIAAIVADQDALDFGDIPSYRHDPAEDKVKSLLADEIEAVTPKRSPKQRKEEIAA